MITSQRIDREALLRIANELIVGHQDYFVGLEATDVEQKAGVLIFRGNYFLNEQGLPGEKSTVVFNVFKFLAVELSSLYHLEH